MADWSFEKAHTWEDLLAAHDKSMLDYNFQKHMAHEERQDGCHSPAEVLGWIKGVQPELALVHQAFSAICETRRLNKAGYAKFRNCSLYGERGLAGETALVNIFQDFLTLEYEQEKLSRYSSSGNQMSSTSREWGIPASISIPISLLSRNSGRKARSR